MKILVVGGTFDGKQGKRSSLIDRICGRIHAYFGPPNYINGGNIDELMQDLNRRRGFFHVQYDAVLWFANVPNTYDKPENLKEKLHTRILVASKRNDNNKYTFLELTQKMLKMRANLFVQFSKEGEKFRMQLFDTLGNEWENTTEVHVLMKKLIRLVCHLNVITRQGCIAKNKIVEVPYNIPIDKFVSAIRRVAPVLTELTVPGTEVNRYLGNASFRCTNGGFPSFRAGNLVFVSRRNVNKEELGKDMFVPTQLVKDDVVYYKTKAGLFKPSVDTPVQLRLYKHYPHINFMLHSHVYMSRAPFTRTFIPCGGLEEIEAITDMYPRKEIHEFAVNLIGHGSLIAVNSVDHLWLYTGDLISRGLPEKMVLKT